MRVGIVTDTRANTLVVPRSALVAEGRRWHLFRLAGEDARKVERIEISRGYEDGDQVEVLPAEGQPQSLETGDRVVVVGASSLSDGAAVQVMESDGAAGVGA